MLRVMNVSQGNAVDMQTRLVNETTGTTESYRNSMRCYRKYIVQFQALWYPLNSFPLGSRHRWPDYRPLCHCVTETFRSNNWDKLRRT